VHLIVFPLALVLAPVSPHVDTLAVDVVIVELSNEHGGVRPLKRTAAVLLAVLVVALVAGAIGPSLHAVAVLLVLHPLAGVLGAVHMNVRALPVRLVVEPLAFVDVAIAMDEATLSVRHVIGPVPLIFGAVLPDLQAAAVAQAVFGPLALVDSAIVKLVWATRNDVLVVHLVNFDVILESSKLLFRFACRRVRVVRQLGQLLCVHEPVAVALLPATVGHASALETTATRSVAHFGFDLSLGSSGPLLIPARLAAAFLVVLLSVCVFAGEEAPDAGLNLDDLVLILNCVVHRLLNLGRDRHHVYVGAVRQLSTSAVIDRHRIWVARAIGAASLSHN
jgi:hypothetical protein